MIKIMVPQTARARTVFRPRPDFGPDSGPDYGALTPCFSYELCGENLAVERTSPRRISRCRESLHGEKVFGEETSLRRQVFAEETSLRRRLPWRAPLHGEALRGESLSKEKESCRGVCYSCDYCHLHIRLFSEQTIQPIRSVES